MTEDRFHQKEKAIGKLVRAEGHRLAQPLPFWDSIRKLLATGFTIPASNWWHLGMAGKLEPFLCPEDCIGQQDYIGLDYYWGTWNLLSIPSLIYAGKYGHFDVAPVRPEFLYDKLRRLSRLFDEARLRHGEGRFPKTLPLMILENGSVPTASGWDRKAYLREHVRQVQRAVQDGIDVRAYICWSLTSNHEWGYPFGPGNNFGLYDVAVHQQVVKKQSEPDLTRHPTPDVDVYRDIVRNRGVVTSPADGPDRKHDSRRVNQSAKEAAMSAKGKRV